MNTKNNLALWNNEITTTQDKVYWKGKLARSVHPSLKRITRWNFIDDYNTYHYDLQNSKVIAGVDRSSLIFMNISTGRSVKRLICDKYKPLYS
ncbi:MAG: hypothetical protein ACFB0B_03770 [Thermonemataceae bacterium]